MTCPIQQSLNAHLSKLDAQDEKEQAIEALAERLSSAASLAVANILRSSNYDLTYKTINNSTNGSDEFNEMFYKVAENLINNGGE
jgi:hypothetical protein